MTFPQKTLTVMFTDLEGYFRMLNEDELRTVEALALHGQLVKKAVEAVGGTLVKYIGDSTLSTFEGPEAALQAAFGIHRALGEYNQGKPKMHKLTDRIGIHAGELYDTGDDIHGLTVAIAALTQGQCRPGNTMVTDTVTSAFEGFEVLENVEFEKVAEKDFFFLKKPVTLYRVRRKTW